MGDVEGSDGEPGTVLFCFFPVFFADALFLSVSGSVFASSCSLSILSSIATPRPDLAPLTRSIEAGRIALAYGTECDERSWDSLNVEHFSAIVL